MTIYQYWLLIQLVVLSCVKDIKYWIQRKLKQLHGIVKKKLILLKLKMHRIGKLVKGGTTYYYGACFYPRFLIILNKVFTRLSRSDLLRFLYSTKGQRIQNHHYIHQEQKKNTGPLIWHLLYSFFWLWTFIMTGKPRLSKATVPFEVEAKIYEDNISEFHGTHWIDWVVSVEERKVIYEKLKSLNLNET